MTISIEDLTFGIESEFVDLWNRDLVDYVNNVGPYPIRLESYGHSVPSQWKITTDQTVSTNYNFRTGDGNGGEIVSPILRGSNGLKEAYEMFKIIHQKVDNNINRNCGLHIHIGKVNGWTVDEIKKINKRFIQHEHLIDEFLPRSRRGNSNRWCQSNSTTNRFNTWLERYNGNRIFDISRNARTRYVKFNVQPLSRQGTIEFRHHSGTTDPKKIVNWIKFLVGFIQASLSDNFDATSYKRKTKRVHAEIREILSMNNWEYKIGGGKCTMISPTGDKTSFSYDQINAFYDNKTESFLRTGVSTRNTRLNNAFNDLLKDMNIISTDVDTGIYYKQEQETIDYLETRKGELS